MARQPTAVTNAPVPNMAATNLADEQAAMFASYPEDVQLQMAL